MTADERTTSLMKRIKQILIYIAPESLPSRLARLVIDEQEDLIAENDRWLVRWLEANPDIPARLLVHEVKNGDHWRWIQAEILKEEKEVS
jgi:hypothetical protein